MREITRTRSTHSRRCTRWNPCGRVSLSFDVCAFKIIFYRDYCRWEMVKQLTLCARTGRGIMQNSSPLVVSLHPSHYFLRFSFSLISRSSLESPTQSCSRYRPCSTFVPPSLGLFAPYLNLPSIPSTERHEARSRSFRSHPSSYLVIGFLVRGRSQASWKSVLSPILLYFFYIHSTDAIGIPFIPCLSFTLEA